MPNVMPVLPADEIDAIASKRETAQREMERRIVAQMLACMDDLSAEPAGADPVGDPGNVDREPGAGAEGRGEDLLQRARRHVVVIGDKPAGVTGVPASAWYWWRRAGLHGQIECTRHAIVTDQGPDVDLHETVRATNRHRPWGRLWQRRGCGRQEQYWARIVAGARPSSASQGCVLFRKAAGGRSAEWLRNFVHCPTCGLPLCCCRCHQPPRLPRSCSAAGWEV